MVEGAISYYGGAWQQRFNNKLSTAPRVMRWRAMYYETRLHTVIRRFLKARLSSGRSIVLFAAIAFMVGNGAWAGALAQESGTKARYQVFLADPLTTEHVPSSGEWRAIDRETRLLSGGQTGYDAGSIGYGGPAGISYFTPRISKMDIGIGLTGHAPNGMSPSSFPASGTGTGNANWRLGGSVGTSSLRLGAAFGDHADPSCRNSENCNTNDFWDIGLAWRFGSGSLAAGYTASLRQVPGVAESETLDIFSISAGYRIAPGLDVFGGIDWIELPLSEQSPDRPRNTRFMLGTNLRF